MSEQYDAIVVGGGHNGLTCAAYLAKAGLRTVVLERRPVIGGAAASEEVVPGFTFSVFSYLMSLLHLKVIADLDLRRFGFEVLPATDMFGPQPDGDSIIFSDDIAKTQKSFARFSKKDAEIYPEFDRYIAEAANVVRKMLLETPIDPTRTDLASLKDMAGFLWRYRRIGDRMYRLVDLLTMSADDFLSRWFESSPVKAVLAYYASIGTFAGPQTPGSAYVIMHHIMGEHAGAGGWGFIRGGMGTIAKAIAQAGEGFGVTIRTNAEAAQIDVAGGRAVGVTTADGSVFRAPIVVSNASCKVTFLKLVDKAALPVDFVTEIRNYRTFSTAFKMNIACERLPQYTAFDPEQAGFAYPTYSHIGPTIEYLEKAYEDAKHGWYSSDPFITPVTPSYVDNTISPPGKHVVHLFGGHAPYELKGSTWEKEREGFVRNVLKKMDEYAPGFSDGIIGMQVLTPPDIERIIGSPHGHIFHGELSPEQLFFKRPAAHYSDYRSPIRGLYQCGSSAHPGGGVGAVPGHNAAREILRDRKRRKV